MKVYLIRHGAVENPKEINYGTLPGWHLSEEGISQISELGTKIKDEGISPYIIVASPLERAQETATILSQALNVEIKTDDRLLEWKMGEWMGKPLKDFYEKSGYYSEEMKTDGMEPLEDLADRVISAIADAIKLCKGDIIICSHREPMAAALVKLQNPPWPEIHNIDMPTGSVWQLNYDQGEFQSAGKIY
ncbi:MAG: histidine phosphatase family protein [Patescibacteria group bacterium]|nr:histidine phosphatase family protein [Patescibacteria group bacterium]